MTDDYTSPVPRTSTTKQRQKSAEGRKNRKISAKQRHVNNSVRSKHTVSGNEFSPVGEYYIEEEHGDDDPYLDQLTPSIETELAQQQLDQLKAMVRNRGENLLK